MSFLPHPADRLVIALDVPTGREALALARRLQGRAGMFKVGLELFCAEGPALVREIQAFAPVFLDLKLHDIPHTVARALEALLPLDPRLVTLHAQGGPAMMEAASAVARAHRAGGGRTELLAVTVLTSLGAADLHRTGLEGDPGAAALRLARLSRDCGCDGAVCSAREASGIRDACGPGFHRLTPGIRPSGTPDLDQARTMTPAQALREGATWLVVGRPVTRAADPAAAAQAVLDEMGGAFRP